MADLIDRIELMRQIAEFGREIPKDQVMEVIARVPTAESTENEARLLKLKGALNVAADAVNDAVRVIETIEALPSADRQKGEWNVLGEWVSRNGCYGVAYCSECNYELRGNNTNFCPNCGADMRGEDE